MVQFFRTDVTMNYKYRQSLWAIRTSQLMLYREIVAVCSEIHTKVANALLAECIILRAVAKLRKAAVSFVMSVCLSLLMEHSAPTGENFMKFYI